MIPKEFVRKYLEIKDMLESGTVNEIKYKILILNLCDEYKVDPAMLSEYNMEVEPKRFDS